MEPNIFYYVHKSAAEVHTLSQTNPV